MFGQLIKQLFITKHMKHHANHLYHSIQSCDN